MAARASGTTIRPIARGSATAIRPPRRSSEARRPPTPRARATPTAAGSTAARAPRRGIAPPGRGIAPAAGTPRRGRVPAPRIAPPRAAEATRSTVPGRGSARRAHRPTAAARAGRARRLPAHARAAAADGGVADMSRHPRLSSIAGAILAGLAGLAAGCAGPSKAEEFGSADRAIEALIAALRANDSSEVRAILGAGSDEVLSSGDDVADKNHIA